MAVSVRALRAPSSAEGGGAPERVVRRRRGMPSGRAVAGGLLVAVAAVGIFAAYRDAAAPPSQRYVVAARRLVAGHVIQPGDLAVVAADLPAVLRRRSFAGRDAHALVGSVAVGAVEQGDLLEASDVMVAGTGRRPQLSFAIDAARALDGDLRPSERVDVVATYGGAGGEGWTAIVARNVEVADVSATGGGLAGGGGLVVTLTVDSAGDVLAVTHAARAGAITLVRSGGDPAGANVYRPTPGSGPGG